MPRIVVLDYGSANLRSAERALRRVGADVVVTADTDAALNAADDRGEDSARHDLALHLAIAAAADNPLFLTVLDFVSTPLLDTIKSADLGSDGAGRLILDFNFAYYPSCAYSEAWVCPLSLAENRLPVAIRGGERNAAD